MERMLCGACGAIIKNDNGLCDNCMHKAEARAMGACPTHTFVKWENCETCNPDARPKVERPAEYEVSGNSGGTSGGGGDYFRGELAKDWNEGETKINYTDAKQTTGKLDLTTVPPAIIESVAKVREHAINGKYKDPDNWRRVPWEEYWRAMLRHILAMMRDPMSYDDESGLLHLEHVACNVAFILEMWKGESDQ